MGIDVSEEGIRLLEAFGFENVLEHDAEDIERLGARYDLIVAGDVLEHMTNPSGLLKSVHPCLNPGGQLLVGLPNAYSWNIARYVLGYEPTHRDHCYSFSVKNICRLCAKFGLLPVELAFTTQQSSSRSRPLTLVRDYLTRLSPRLAPSFLMRFKEKSAVDLARVEKETVWR